MAAVQKYLVFDLEAESGRGISASSPGQPQNQEGLMKNPRMKQDRARSGISVSLVFALLLLFAAISQAQTEKVSTLQETRRISLSLSQVPIQAFMRTLFTTVDAKVVVDPSVTGMASVDFDDVSFQDALRTCLNGADQPLSCSLKDGVYYVGLRTSGKDKTVSNRVGMVDLPLDMKVTESSSQGKAAEPSLPFVYTTHDICFQESYSHALDSFTNAAPIPQRLNYPLLMDGSVVIKILVPNKMLTISRGRDWTLADGSKCSVLNLSPVHRMLLDRGSETVETRGGVVTIEDKKGHSVTIYPYPQTAAE